MILTVLSFNVHKGKGWYKSESTFKEIDEHIRVLSPDIIFFQEILGAQAQYIVLDLWPYYSYGKNVVHTMGHYGNAIFSKFPISYSENFDLSTSRFDKRGLLHSVIELPNQTPLHLLCVHLGLFKKIRQVQFDKIVAYIESSIPREEPMILGGDFNDWGSLATKPLVRKLNLHEAFLTVEGHYARTFPAWGPLLKLDRIYCRGMSVTAADRLTEKHWTKLSDHLAITAVFEINKASILHPYHETVLVDDNYFHSLMNDINHAKLRIDLETYIFNEDDLGHQIISALRAAAKRGVRIRVLVDGIGTPHWKNLQEKMQLPGIEVKAYHPILGGINGSFKNFIHFLTHINSRNHRKTCVIDSKIAYIGGANITAYSLHKSKREKWHDITIKVVGLNLNQLEFAFIKAWFCRKFKYLFLIKKFPENNIRLNYSRFNVKKLYKDLQTRIKNANNRINITNAYFIPRRLLLIRLIRASRRGVPVTIIIPQNPDVMGMSLLMSSFYYILLKNHVKIFQHTKGILHTKFLMIDDWFCVGSSNFNYRSLHHDLEADITIQTTEAKAKLEKQFDSYLLESKPVTIETVNKQTFFEKMAIKFLWLIRFWF